MEIGKYKQAMNYLLNQNATVKTFPLNPNASLSDNDPQPVLGFEQGGRVGYVIGGNVQNNGLSQLDNGRYQYRAYRSGKQIKRVFDTKEEALNFKKEFETKLDSLDLFFLRFFLIILASRISKSLSLDSPTLSFKTIESWRLLSLTF